jgi:uncharacterized membrane protein YkvI
VGLTALIVVRATTGPSRPLAGAWDVLRLLLIWTTLATILAAGGEVIRHLTRWPTVVGSTMLAALAAVLPSGVRGRRVQGGLVALLGVAVLCVSAAAWRLGLPPLEVRAEWPVLPSIGSATLPGRAGDLPAGADFAAPGRPLTALMAAMLYASYTSALVEGVEARAGAADARRATSAYLAAAVIAGLLAAMSVTVARWGTIEAPLPMLAVACGLGSGVAGLYAWLLGVAAANSAVANAGLLSRRLAAVCGGERRARLLVTLLALAASLLGFANLVGWLYPALGWAWLPAALGWWRRKPGRPRHG